MQRSHLAFGKDSPFKLVHGLLKDRGSISKQLAATKKPPNILIVTERKSSVAQWRKLLQRVLSEETYVIYGFSKADLSRGIWKAYTSLLILDHINELDHVQQTFIEGYLHEGGKALCHCSTYPRKDEEEVTWCGNLVTDNVPIPCFFSSNGDTQYLTVLAQTKTDYLNNRFSEPICTSQRDEKPLLVSRDFKDGKLTISAIDFIATEIKLHAEEGSAVDVNKLFTLLQLTMQGIGLQNSNKVNYIEVKPTVGVVMGNPKMVAGFATHIKENISSQPNTDFYLNVIENKNDVQNLDFADEKFTVIIAKDSFTAGSEYGIKFHFETYWRELKSREFGRLFIYTDVIGSTQTVLDRIVRLLPVPHSFMVVAGQQTQGKGRSGNMWLSPFGCMMFSLSICIPSSSVVGQKMTFLQHIAAVALVAAVKEQPGYENLTIGIKWPNDIYAGDSIKIGGLIVSSSFVGGIFNAIIGMGVNVSNEKPTVCLNTIIEEYNLLNQMDLKPLTMEQLMARTITKLEQLIELFECQGCDAFCKIYYKYWLHSNQKVKLHTESSIVTVKGLDANGFLLVENDNGEFLSLQPDGNSFDMMEGLISIRRNVAE